MMLFKLFQKRSVTPVTSEVSTSQVTSSTETELETGSQPTQISVPTEPEPSIQIITKPVMNKDFIKNIHQIPLDRDEFLNEEWAKYQIYLHHTAGGASARNVVSNWNNDDRGRIATCVTISNTGASNSPDGEIVQAFSSKYWAYHLGVKNSHFQNMEMPYKPLDKHSIGIELCAWGPLTLKDGKFYNYVKREVPADQVCQLLKPFKGYTYYHKYSDAQIESLKNLLLYWNDVYDIPLDYNEDIWGLTERAYALEPGIYTHNSVRPDKTDIFPQPNLIAMLKSLS